MKIVTPITAKYPIGKCLPCATELRKALNAAGFAVSVWEITSNTQFIVLAETSLTAGLSSLLHKSITENGKHYGVEVEGQIFDNLFKTGIAAREWPKQFEVREGYTLKFDPQFYPATKK